MAGKRHHYVPRWLQAGFADNGAGAGSRTWCFSKNAEASGFWITKDTGVTKNFYSYGVNGERQDADLPMTSHETNAYQRTFNGAAAGEAGPLKNTNELAKLFGHVYMRSKGVRRYAESVVGVIFEVLLVKLITPGVALEMLNRTLETATQGQGSVYEVLSTVVTEQAQAIDEELVRHFSNPASFKQFVYPRLADAVKVGHIESLLESSDFSASALAKCLSNYSFFLHEDLSAAFVQGDSPLVFKSASGGGYTPLFDESLEFDFVFLPISSTRLLIAKRTDTPLPPAKELQEAAIMCSNEHFISKDESGRCLAEMIGKLVPSITFEEANLQAESFIRSMPQNLESLKDFPENASAYFMNLLEEACRHFVRPI